MSKFYLENDLKRAILLAAEAHSSDSWGVFPYLTHLALVAEEVRAMRGNDYKLLVAAWLHDVVEDHPEYADKIKEEFPEVYPIVLMVSRREDESYSEFIARIIDSHDEDAIVIKTADMRVNGGNSPRESLRKRYENNIVKLEKVLLNFSQN